MGGGGIYPPHTHFEVGGGVACTSIPQLFGGNKENKFADNKYLDMYLSERVFLREIYFFNPTLGRSLPRTRLLSSKLCLISPPFNGNNIHQYIRTGVDCLT